MYDTEATINNRPLTYISEDPRDHFVLTPAHFQFDIVSNTTEDLDKIDPKYLRRRAMYLQEIRRRFTERFKQKYLRELSCKNSRTRPISE